MKQDRENMISGVIVVLFLLTISLPFVIAQFASNESMVFGGFLINPNDGNSYLAKMRQGFNGGWTFTLPYAAEPGKGVAINLYYLLLGHLSSWLHLPLILTFHLARIFGSFLLALALIKLLKVVFRTPSIRLLALGMVMFGSGFGWIAAGFDLFTSDFWVAEAYPFLASFANAHFPLGLALQVWLITPAFVGETLSRKKGAMILMGAVALSVVYPFGWLVAVIVIFFQVAFRLSQKRLTRKDLLHSVILIVGGAPYIAYAFWVVNIHPALAQWNFQNSTPAPGLIDIAIAFSPALIAAIFGTLTIARERMSTFFQLMIWVIVGVIIIYLPFSLQRRLMSGLFIPIAFLAIFAIEKLKSARWRRGLAAALLLLSLPTNILILAGGIQAARRQDPSIFLYHDELAAYQWLEENTATGSILLASPASGLLIPAYSSARVLYGHPFETPNAMAQESMVIGFFTGEIPLTQIAKALDGLEIDYVFYGPQERQVGRLSTLTNWYPVYDQGKVQIWAPNQ